MGYRYTSRDMRVILICEARKHIARARLWRSYGMRAVVFAELDIAAFLRRQALHYPGTPEGIDG